MLDEMIDHNRSIDLKRIGSIYRKRSTKLNIGFFVVSLIILTAMFAFYRIFKEADNSSISSIAGLSCALFLFGSLAFLYFLLSPVIAYFVSLLSGYFRADCQISLMNTM